MSNEDWYNLFSTLIIGAGILFAAAVIISVVYMIVKWRSPEVQDLEAPVRQYLLTEEERADYRAGV